jgi:hypothetical protein
MSHWGTFQNQPITTLRGHLGSRTSVGPATAFLATPSCQCALLPACFPHSSQASSLGTGPRKPLDTMSTSGYFPSGNRRHMWGKSFAQRRQCRSPRVEDGIAAGRGGWV